MDTAVKDINAQTDSSPVWADECASVSIGCGAGYLFLKRFMDILLSAIAIIVLALPLTLVLVMIKMDSKGPAFFCQKRMGKDGKIFVIYKFRTMKCGAPSEVASRELNNPENYVTKFGAFLRRTSIDELPQLFNIIKGDMSIVGYRPVCLSESKLNDLRARYGVFALRPGITGLAQVSGRDNITSYVDKARLDARYVSTCSAKTDIQCLMKTIKIVISGEGAN